MPKEQNVISLVQKCASNACPDVMLVESGGGPEVALVQGDLVGEGSGVNPGPGEGVVAIPMPLLEEAVDSYRARKARTGR